MISTTAAQKPSHLRRVPERTIERAENHRFTGVAFCLSPCVQKTGIFRENIVHLIEHVDSGLASRSQALTGQQQAGLTEEYVVPASV